MPTDGPAAADLVAVSVDGERLVIRFDTAEAVPQVPEGPESIVYMLLIDTDGMASRSTRPWSEYTDFGNEDLGDDGWVGLLWHPDGDHRPQGGAGGGRWRHHGQRRS